MSGIFFFNDTATTEIYTLSLHDALPILLTRLNEIGFSGFCLAEIPESSDAVRVMRYYRGLWRSEEHTSELQSPCNLVCRLLLEKKNLSIQRLNAESDTYHTLRHHTRLRN